MQSKNIKRKKANEARLDALKRKAEQQEQSKSQIRKALEGLDFASTKASHITFSDSEDSVEEVTLHNKTPVKAGKDDAKVHDILGIHNDPDSSEENSFALKPQFEGKGGERLLELQTTFRNDSRFRLDERFAEKKTEESSSDEEIQSTNNVASSKDELAKNMKILEEIVGSKIKSKHLTKRGSTNFVDASARRYDPQKNSNLEIVVEKEPIKKSKSKKKKTEEPLPEVDTKRFFQASTTALKNVFGSKTKEELEEDSLEEDEPNEPFSFLAMLGRNDVENLTKQKIEEQAVSHLHLPLAKHGRNIPTLSQPFHHDSSDTDTEEEMDTAATNNDNVSSKEDEKVQGPQGGGVLGFPKTLFLSSPEDKRFEYGVKEFCVKKSFKEMQEEWLSVKDNLIQDYKKKHRDAKRKAKIEAKKQKYESAIK